MIPKLMRMASLGCIYFCVATITAQIVALGMLGWKGHLTSDNIYTVLAIMQNVDVVAMEAELRTQQELQEAVQVAYQDILKQRTKASLDLDLRETALEKGLGDLENLEKNLVEQKNRYEKVLKSFEGRLKELQEGSTDRAIEEVQRTLETMVPKQAKNQILKMLEAGQEGDVVTVLMAMPLDKRKRIIGEFKEASETEQLFEILQAILQGKGEGELIRQTREQIKALKPGQE